MNPNGIIDKIYEIVVKVMHNHGYTIGTTMPEPKQYYPPRSKFQRALTMTFGAMALMKEAAQAEPEDKHVEQLIATIRHDLLELQQRLTDNLRTRDAAARRNDDSIAWRS